MVVRVGGISILRRSRGGGEMGGGENEGKGSDKRKSDDVHYCNYGEH